MSQNLQLKRSEKNVGDTAVDGLLVGIAAGIGMIIYLLMAGWLAGESPLVVVNRFDIVGGGSWLVALLAHTVEGEEIPEVSYKQQCHRHRTHHVNVGLATF